MGGGSNFIAPATPPLSYKPGQMKRWSVRWTAILIRSGYQYRMPDDPQAQLVVACER